MRMPFTSRAPKRLNINALTPRELADLPHFHPLADEAVKAKLAPYQPRLNAVWPWSAGR